MSHLPQWISYVALEVPGLREPSIPREIILKYSDAVVVPVSYTDDDEWKQHGTLIAELDAEGNGLARFPITVCKKFMDTDEAYQIMQAYDADQQLLGYAR